MSKLVNFIALIVTLVAGVLLGAFLLHTLYDFALWFAIFALQMLVGGVLGYVAGAVLDRWVFPAAIRGWRELKRQARLFFNIVTVSFA